MTAALVQSSTAASGGGSVATTLGATPTAGNMLFAVANESDGATGTPPTAPVAGSGRSFTFISSSKAHANGGNAHLYYRVAQAGDSATISFPDPGGNWAIAAAEFSGVGTAPVGSPATMPTASTGPTMGIAIAQGAGTFVIAAFATRANLGAAGFTPNGSTNSLGVVATTYDNAMWGWGIGNITIGGTATGGSRNAGDPWAGAAQAFTVAAARAWAVGIIG